MNKHTPTPWHVGGHDKSTVYDKFGQRIANSFEGVPVVQKSDETCAANAEFIVRCVNSHEALVKALTDMLELRDLTMASRVNPDKPELSVVENARAALAAAGAPQ